MRVAARTAAWCLVALVFAACSSDDPNLPDANELLVHILKPADVICVSPGSTVDFEAAAGGGKGTITLSWDFGDPSIPGASDSKKTVTFNNKGVWTVTVTATTATETASESVTVRVKDDCTPVEVLIDNPVFIPHITAGVSVSFAGSVSGGDAPYTYHWDFGGAGIPAASVEDPGPRQFNIPGTYHVTFTAHDAVGDSSSAMVDVVVEPVPGEPPVGIIPVAVNSPDGMHLFNNLTGYAGITSEFVLLVAGGDGVAVLDPVSGAALSNRFVVASETRFGVAALSHALSGGSPAVRGSGASALETREDVLIQYGPTTTLTPYDRNTGDWSTFSMVIENFSTVYDVSPYNGALDAEGAINVTSSRVSFLGWDDASSSYQLAGNDILGNAFPGALSLVSAFGRGPTGRIVVVSSGSPGALYTHDRNGGDGSLVGSVGDDPRKVRGVDSLLVVTDFGSDSLTVAKWSANGAVSIVGNVAVGDGPVGVDLMPLGAGDVAVVTTGFNDNTFTVTVFDADGGVVSNTTTALPAGCTSPGHAVWVGSPSTRIIVSCFGSDNLVVVESGL